MKLLLLLPPAILLAAQAAGVDRSHPEEPRPSGHASFDLEDLAAEAGRSARDYLPFLDRPTLSAGLYRLPAGGTDRQSPHELDELYHVVSGRARFTAGGVTYDARPGTVLFVERGVEHRFHDIEEDLSVLVFFSKAPAAEEAR